MTLLPPSEHRGRRKSIQIPHDQTPGRLEIEDGTALFPDWDGARDDSGVLRRCILCGEEQLFRRKLLPQVTGLVVVLAFTLALLSILGYFGGPVVLGIMVALLLIDLAILFFSPQSLECYRCHAEYRDLEMGSWHKPWSRSLARRLAQDEGPLESG